MADKEKIQQLEIELKRLKDVESESGSGSRSGDTKKTYGPGSSESEEDKAARLESYKSNPNDFAPPIRKTLASVDRRNFINNAAANFASPTTRAEVIGKAQKWVTKESKKIAEDLDKYRSTLVDKGLDYYSIQDLLAMRAKYLNEYLEEATDKAFPYNAMSYLRAKGIKTN